MAKKANLRQEQIVTLTDYHREEIVQIHCDQQSMLQQYDEKKQGFHSSCFVRVHLIAVFSIALPELRRQLLEKEQRLVQVNEDLESMQGYKVCADFILQWFDHNEHVFSQSIQEAQNAQIKCLQDQLAQVRSEHVCQMAKIKLKLEEEIHQQRTDDDAHVHLVRRQAEKVVSLAEHPSRISHTHK